VEADARWLVRRGSEKPVTFWQSERTGELMTLSPIVADGP